MSSTTVAAPPAPAAPDASAPRALHAALFDIDGTLSDTDVHHRAVFRELLAREGIDCDSAFFEARISGRANAAICAEILPHLSAQQQEEWVQMKESLFRQRAADGLEPLEGLIPLLAAMRARGVRVAAVTNAPRLNALMILESLQLLPGSGAPHAFDELVLGEECSHAKPHPEPYLEAMRRLGVTPAQCAVFEDSPTGIQAGRASGAVTVGIRSSQTDEVLRKAGAHITVAHFAEIDADKLISTLENFHVDQQAP